MQPLEAFICANPKEFNRSRKKIICSASRFTDHPCSSSWRQSFLPKFLLLIGLASPVIAYLNLHLVVFASGVAGCVVYVPPDLKSKPNLRIK
jgi:hypothetical protein